MEAFMVWGLPVLQSLVASSISNIALKDLYSNDGSDNDAFRKIMREAFNDAVKKTRKDDNDAVQNRHDGGTDLCHSVPCHSIN
jgi:hypothetical protein